MHAEAQGLGDLHKRIHGRRFLSAFHPADKNSREVCFFRKLLLTEVGSLALSTNGFTKETAMLLSSQHGGSKEQEARNPAMLLTTSFCLQTFRLIG